MFRGCPRYLMVVAMLLAAGVAYWGMGRWKTAAAEGGPIIPPTTRPTASAPQTLRLATFNIHSGVGADDRCNLERVASVLKGCDLVALQEVAGERPWEANQVVALAEQLGMAGLFSPTETHFWYSVFGNGVLTNTLINRWSRTPLPNGFHMAHRDIIHLTVPFGKGTLNVLTVHMGKKSDRARQFAMATKMFKSLPAPAVLMGDLNTRPYDGMMQAFLKNSDAHDVIGEHIQPVDRVDFILTRGVRCTDAGLLTNDASDHPAAWAQIEAD